MSIIVIIIIFCSVAGLISSKTKNYINEKMLSYHNETSKCDVNSENHNHALMYLRKQSVADKTVINVLKSLTGAYLVVIAFFLFKSLAKEYFNFVLQDENSHFFQEAIADCVPRIARLRPVSVSVDL